MTYDEALEYCTDQITFCANIYGAKWREHEEFLKVCQKALEVVLSSPEGFTDEERELIGDTFQNYHMTELYQIANFDDVAESIFVKLGLIEKRMTLDDEQEAT